MLITGTDGDERMHGEATVATERRPAASRSQVSVAAAAASSDDAARLFKSVVAMAEAMATTPLTRCGWRRRVAARHPSVTRAKGGRTTSHVAYGRSIEPLTTAATWISRPAAVPPPYRIV